MHDRAYARLSRAADQRLLWYSVAATLVAVGRHRAAIRGVGSMVVSSVVSDVIVKSFFDGRRPVFDEVPTIRRLRAYPTTPSFPSGHSASAAGFATGVALESGQGRPIIVAPLAAAVAYSRCTSARTGSRTSWAVWRSARDRPLGRLVVPARARRATPAPEVEQVVELIDLPPSPDGAGVLIVMNQGAGTAVIRIDPRPKIAERLPAAVVRELEPDETMDDVVREIMAGDDPPRGCSACTAATGRLRAWPIWPSSSTGRSCRLPGGTFNHFSRSAGIESVDLAIDALQAGSGIAATVGELTAGGRTTTVMNAASIGIYPEFVAERTKRKARLGKWIGGVAATWRGLRDAEPIDIVIARPAGAGLVGVRERRAQHARPGRDLPAADHVGRRARCAGAARARLAPAGGRGALFRRRDAGRPACAATAAAGIRHRAHHRDRHRDLGAAPIRARRPSTRTTGS